MKISIPSFARLRDYDPDREGEFAFVVGNWFRSFRPWAGPCIDPYVSFAYSKTIEAILKSDTAKTLVACSIEDDDQIFGFACFDHEIEETPIIHYVFVRDDLPGVRGAGLGGALFRYAATGRRTTTRTFDTKSSREYFRNSREFRSRYKPWKVFEYERQETEPEKEVEQINDFIKYVVKAKRRPKRERPDRKRRTRVETHRGSADRIAEVSTIDKRRGVDGSGD